MPRKVLVGGTSPKDSWSRTGLSLGYYEARRRRMSVMGKVR
jgi:hypothetical protein